MHVRRNATVFFIIYRSFEKKKKLFDSKTKTTATITPHCITLITINHEEVKSDVKVKTFTEKTIFPFPFTVNGI